MSIFHHMLHVYSSKVSFSVRRKVFHARVPWCVQSHTYNTKNSFVWLISSRLEWRFRFSIVDGLDQISHTLNIQKRNQQPSIKSFSFFSIFPTQVRVKSFLFCLMMQLTTWLNSRSTHCLIFFGRMVVEVTSNRYKKKKNRKSKLKILNVKKIQFGRRKNFKRKQNCLFFLRRFMFAKNS